MATNSLIQFLSGRGAVSAADLRQALGMSPATLSRRVAAAGGAVLRLGRGRATHYALTRELPGLAARVPVYRINAQGREANAGELVLLDNGGAWVAALSGGGYGLEGLPPFVHDMAPAGYLGRRFTDRHPDLGLPPRLQDWSDTHRLVAVARRGEDCPGDLVVGEESMQRWLQQEPMPVTQQDYPELARKSALGGAGSSAAGEQPKFAAYSEGRHVLVKFTPGDESPGDRRWRDLLLCEGVALDVLAEAGILAPSWQVHDIGTRRYLELQRFDRTGNRGRIGVITLAALDDELYGQRDNWTAAAQRLHADGLLSAMDSETVALLEAFGVCIANGDRHFGNLVFYADMLDPKPTLRLAPVFDMLPMDFAPRTGEVPGIPGAPVKLARLLSTWEQGRELAGRYWHRLSDDTRLSAEMRRLAAGMASLL